MKKIRVIAILIALAVAFVGCKNPIMYRYLSFSQNSVSFIPTDFTSHNEVSENTFSTLFLSNQVNIWCSRYDCKKS